MAVAVPVLILNMCLVLSIPVMIGVYVYRDASDRGMNAAGWTAVAVLAPAFTGLIIYLLVRSGSVPLKCPKCGTRVRESFVLCPGCGAKLRYTCKGCGRPVEPDWKLCPACGRPVEEEPGVVTPVYRKTNTLKYILIIIGAVFLLTVAISAVSFSMVGSSSMSMTFAPPSDYEDNEEIAAWIEEAKDGDSRVYALKSTEEQGDVVVTRYLIVCPEIADKERPDTVSRDSGVFERSGVFSTELEARINTASDYGILYVEYTGSREAGLKVTVDGHRADCEITETDSIPRPGEER